MYRFATEEGYGDQGDIDRGRYADIGPDLDFTFDPGLGWVSS